MSFGGGGGIGSGGFGSTAHGSSSSIRYLVRYTFQVFVTLTMRSRSYIVKKFKAKVTL